MDKGLYVAMTGAQAALSAQAAVANNLANKDTNGFKAERVATDVFVIPGAGLATRVDALAVAPGYDASPGPLRSTGNESDIALRDGVWLGVTGADGQEAFTRAGDLHITAEGMLTTASGRPVLGEGGPISVPPHSKLSIGGDGTISIQPLGQGPKTMATVGRLRLGQTDNPQQLQRGLDGLMRASSPLPQATGNAVSAGVLEGSNVDTAGTLVQMIELSRTFEMQMKILHNGDEMARSSNSLLRSGG